MKLDDFPAEVYPFLHAVHYHEYAPDFLDQYAAWAKDETGTVLPPTMSEEYKRLEAICEAAGLTPRGPAPGKGGLRRPRRPGRAPMCTRPRGTIGHRGVRRRK